MSLMFEVAVKRPHPEECQVPEGESGEQARCIETPEEDEETCGSVQFNFENGLMADKLDILVIGPEATLEIAMNQLRLLHWNEKYKALNNLQFWHSGIRLLSFESPYLEKRKTYSVLDVVQTTKFDKGRSGENIIIIEVKAKKEQEKISVENGENKWNLGYEIIKVFTPKELVEKQRNFLEVEEAFPEFKQDFIQKHRLPYVLGGFAAYGNPSSFHNSFVKGLRRLVKDKVIETKVFERYLASIKLEPSLYKMELLFDRMLHRYATQKPNAECVHRDITPPEYLHAGDVVFGGWLNLSHEPQSFSCVPGSHVPSYVAPERDKTNSGFMKLNEGEIQQFKNSLEPVSVPAGHLLIFNQTMVHEVVSKLAGEQMRLFMGWRLTTSDHLLFGEEKKEFVEKLSVPHLPSGQRPVMYSSNHVACFHTKTFSAKGNKNDNNKINLQEWLERAFVEEVKARMADDKKCNPQYPRFTARAMESLANYELAEGYRYTEDDKNLMLNLHPLQSDQ